MMRYGLYGYPHMSGWGWGLGWVAEALFLGLLIWLIVKVFLHAGNRHEDERDREPEALNILKTRYAKGELTRKEFEDMKKDLS